MRQRSVPGRRASAGDLGRAGGVHGRHCLYAMHNQEVPIVKTEHRFGASNIMQLCTHQPNDKEASIEYFKELDNNIMNEQISAT